MVTIRHANDQDLPAVRKFYDAAGYRAEINQSDTLVLAHASCELVGVVRLTLEQHIVVLRGMQIAPEWRRRGIGLQVLDEVQRTLGARDCYCVPYAHLVDFYGRIGFRETIAEACPHFLVERRTGYQRARSETFVLMYRPGQSQGASA